MRRFLIIPYNREHIESSFDDQHLLKDLEIMTKERICRKPCRCSACKNTIPKGEKALKTIQYSNHHGYWYNTYCQNCYKEKDEVNHDQK